MVLSSYIEIDNLVVPKDNLLRRMNELIDFLFVYDELIHKYCLENGMEHLPVCMLSMFSPKIKDTTNIFMAGQWSSDFGIYGGVRNALMIYEIEREKL